MPQSDGFILERPRLHSLLKDAMEYPLVIVCAGAGYGKTRAVFSFLQDYEAHTTWLQLSERDNNTTRFWESYTGMLSISWPDAGARLVENGFPDTDEEFEKYTSTMHEVAALPGKHIRLFDDFHLLHNPAVLRFFRRSLTVIPPNVTMLLISRTTSDASLIGMMMQEHVFVIQEDVLCFSEEEIAQYFSHLQLPVSKMDIRNIYDDTRGWAFAVNLIGRSLRKEQKYVRYALEAMKKNIVRLVEAEIVRTVSEPLWRFLLRLSLIDHLAANLVNALAGDDALIREMGTLNAYIRYDFRMDTYLIHHLFLDCLRQKQDTLTAKEKRETYQKAGDWCDANGYHMDAFSYYEKCGDYAAITRKVGAYNIQMPPDMARYAMDLFDNAPESVKRQNPNFAGLHIRLAISAGRFNEGSIAMALEYAEDYEARPESPDRYRALSIIYFNWAFLLMFMSTYTHIYDFDIYFQKLGENYAKNPFKTIGKFNLVPISTWASLVGTDRVGAQEEFIEAISRSIPATSALGQGFLVGFDDLARGELYFLRGEYDEAAKYLKRSADKAFACDQYTTHNRALVYLMRIAFVRGDFVSADDMLRSMEALLNEEDFGVRYTMYDIACGFYHLMLEQPERTPEWLKGDFSSYMHPSFIENYANRVKAQYHFQTRQYSALLAFFELEMDKQIILYGNIELRVLQALSLYQLKRRDEAIAALSEVYHLAESNQIITLFTQFAKDMRTLTAAALKDDTCTIPKEWLEDINRRSSALAKRKAKMISDYRAASHQGEEISLSNREREILIDLSHGLSRAEIAASQNISINTVKMVINTIYKKLSANSLADAIRIAAERKMI